MRKDEIIGKKLYYKEAKLGDIVDIRRNPLGSHHEVAVVETSRNDFKVAPASYLRPVADRYEFTSDRALLDGFPSLSNKEIENDSDKLKEAIQEHYGSPESWDEDKMAKNERKDQGYMGANAAHNRGAPGNESLKDKVDYDKITGKDD